MVGLPELLLAVAIVAMWWWLSHLTFRSLSKRRILFAFLVWAAMLDVALRIWRFHA